MVSEKVRVRFYKKGKLKFISHLDLVRTFKSAFSRAGVPIWYTEGFDPHPKMVFSPPLPIGAESECEFVDIRLTKPCDPRKLIEDINSQLTADMQVTAIYAQKNDSRAIASARYTITLCDGFSRGEIEKALAGPLMITKKTKKGMVDTDLSPKIKSCCITEEGSALTLDIVLGASEEDFVNPAHLIKALGAYLGRELIDYSILRVAEYLADGREFV